MLGDEGSYFGKLAFCPWKKRLAGPGVLELRRPRQVAEEKRKLQQMVAGLYSSPRVPCKDSLFQQVEVLGAADKAASLGGESPLPSIAWFGRLAYPMHVPVTVRVLLGRRSRGCPAAFVSQR